MTFLFRCAILVISLSLISRANAQEGAQVDADGAKIRIIFSSTPAEPLRKLVLDWIKTSARAIILYYDRFPVSDLPLKVRFFDGKGIRGGRTTGWDGPFITIAVGLANDDSDFARDWMLTHEMVHLAFPSVADEHHWIEEGSATYVEPIARAQAGYLTPEKVWGDLVDGLPKGLPQSGDKGLDFTPTWGRTYWGGALFCLMADIEIHKRTGNKKGLQDAFRAILKAGGTVEADWPLSRAFDVGDQATGVPVLHELDQKMRDTPAPVDLDGLWKQLGVERRDGRITFRDDAPLAGVRKAITQPMKR